MNRLGRTLLVAASACAVIGLGADQSTADHSPGDGNHWSDENGSKAFVTIVDKTGPQWPVQASALEWAKSQKLAVVYRYNDCAGFGHCVSVDESSFAGYTCDQNPGVTYTPQDGSRHLTQSTFTLFNSKCNDRSDYVQRVMTCHEEGHIMGLGEEEQSLRQETCMAQAQLNHPPFAEWSNKPRAHDFATLDTIMYTHGD